MGRNAELLGAAMGAGAAMVLEERVCATGEGFTEGAEGRERVWRGMMKVEMSAGSKKPARLGRTRARKTRSVADEAGRRSVCVPRESRTGLPSPRSDRAAAEFRIQSRTLVVERDERR